MKNQKLERGNYFGTVVKRDQLPGLVMTETVYQPRLRVPHHSHVNPYFCLVLKGGYTETYNKKMRECKAMTLAFHPSEEGHSEQFHDESVRSFNVEVQPSYTQRVRQHSSILDRPAAFQGGSLCWLGTKLYREFVYKDSVSPLAIEGLVLEIMADGSRESNQPLGARPRLWLKQARDLLQARFMDPLTVTEIATAVDVHPVHLSREFHKHYHSTIGQYVRQLKVGLACRKIIEDDPPLAQVAIEAGFFDQSHFSRVFKSLTGVTPSQFRESRHRR
jgi:AraC family transcriptional regulator